MGTLINYMRKSMQSVDFHIKIMNVHNIFGMNL